LLRSSLHRKAARRANTPEGTRGIVKVQPTVGGTHAIPEYPPRELGGLLRFSLQRKAARRANTPEGTRGIVQVQPTARSLLDARIPPRGLGGWFRSSLQREACSTHEYPRGNSGDGSGPAYSGKHARRTNTPEATRGLIRTTASKRWNPGTRLLETLRRQELNRQLLHLRSCPYRSPGFRNVTAACQMVLQVARHRLAVVGNENESVILTPPQYLRIESALRWSTRIANHVDDESWLSTKQLLSINWRDVLIQQIPNWHHFASTVCCSLSLRSFSTTGGGFRSWVSRALRLNSSQSARYASTGSRL
jgi:hypothetical protein